MMPFGWHEGGWGILWMLLAWGAFIALAWGLISALTSDGTKHQPDRDPRDVLAERFAEGEIDAEEYRQRLHVLEEAQTTKSAKR